MTTRRTLVWLILFVITVPTVAATADALQRAQHEDTLIRIPDLREGDRYVYDLHWSSEAREVVSTTRGHLVVEVGARDQYTMFDGTLVDVLPVTLQTNTPPWMALEGASGQESVTQYLRIPDGLLVATETHEHTKGYANTASGQLVRTERWQDRLVEHTDAYRNGILGASGGPGRSYVNANEVFHAILSVSGLIEGQRIAGTANLRGATVYNSAGYEWTSGGGLVYCHLPFSGISYREPVDEQTQQKDYEGTHATDIWVSEAQALPHAESCDSTFVDKKTGAWVDTVRLELVLATYTPGADPVGFDVRRPLALPVAEPLPAAPVLVPGLPVQGDVDLLFPLDEALGVILTMPQVSRFKDDGETPFMVTSFSHLPASPTRRPSSETSGDVPNPWGILPSEIDSDAPKVDAIWHFTLQNAAGEHLGVTIDRAYDAQGDVVDEEREVRPRDAWEARLSDFPETLVPLSEVIGAHARHRGLSTQDWLAHPESAFSSSAGLHTQTTIGKEIRELRMEVSFKDAPSDSPGRAEWGSASRDYDLKTGAATSQSEGHGWSEAADGRPQGRAPPALHTATVVPVPHVPAAATASGLAVALAFAAAYFWEGLSRFLGQAVAAPMYAKIRKEKVLDHKTRDDIMTFVTENPGAALGSVRGHIGAGYGTTVHHLNTLEQNRLLTSRKVGRQRCYFPAGVFAPSDMDATAASGTAAAERLLRIVEREPGLSQQEVAARLGIADASVRYQAKRLLAHGRLRAERDGRAVRYFPCAVEVTQ